MQAQFARATQEAVLKESEIIRWLRERVVASPAVPLGIGDDAAVLDLPGGGRSVVTTDMLIEGTHFAAEDPPREVGWKALAVSVSDVAAMGCRAVAAVLAVGLSRERGRTYAEELLEGVQSLAREFDLPLVGGDTTESPGPVILCSTVIGVPEVDWAPVLRSGAKPGHAVLVTGSLGGSLEGRHLRFRPRQDEALELTALRPASAMIDLSDGLSTDAAHIARESGVRIRIFAGEIPVSETAVRTEEPLRHALDDGEDFELLFTVRREWAAGLVEEGLSGTTVTCIGEVVEGPPGVTLVHTSGREETLREGGYEHFR